MDLIPLYTIFKGAALLAAMIVASSLAGCGVSAGQLCVGSTGFLREHNRARVISDYEPIDRRSDVEDK